jgi:hypothetical protein
VRKRGQQPAGRRRAWRLEAPWADHGQLMLAAHRQAAARRRRVHAPDGQAAVHLQGEDVVTRVQGSAPATAISSFAGLGTCGAADRETPALFPGPCSHRPSPTHIVVCGHKGQLIARPHDTLIGPARIRHALAVADAAAEPATAAPGACQQRTQGGPSGASRRLRGGRLLQQTVCHDRVGLLQGVAQEVDR